MTDPHDHIQREIDRAAAKADATLDAQEEAEQTLAELSDLADKQTLYYENMVKRGLPAKVAAECVATMADNYWFARFQAQFRPQR